MKQIALILSIFLVCSFTQIVLGQSKIGIGLYGAPSLETLIEGQHINNYYVQKYSTHAGIQADIQINKRLALYAGVSHYAKGGQMSFIDSSNFASGNIGMSTLKANYIAIPIILDVNVYTKHRAKFRKMKVYRMSKKGIHPFVLSVSLGFVYGYGYDQGVENIVEATSAPVDHNSLHLGQAKFIGNIMNFNQTYLGVTGGLRATFNLNQAISISLRPNVSYQLNGMSDVTYDETYESSVNLPDPKLSGAGVEVGISFTIR